jgi:gluconolactonase
MIPPECYVRAFDVQPDGTIAHGWIFAEEKGEGGVPDGIKVDQRENVYVTGPHGIWIFNPSGKHLDVIEVSENTANLGWGGDDWQTLFIMVSTSIYCVQCKIAGIPVS